VGPTGTAASVFAATDTPEIALLYGDSDTLVRVRSRSVYLIAAMLVALAGYACRCQAPLIWDGAYQFNATLIMQRPYMYETRFHTLLFWWPTVWASRHCASVAVLQSLFGLPFLLAAPASLLMSWWIVRSHAPRLIFWAIFGMAACLPGQIFVINDSTVLVYLFWPVFLGLFVPLSGLKKCALGFLCLFQFIHPLGVLLLAGATGTALAMSVIDPAHRRRLLLRASVMGAVFSVAVFKIAIVAEMRQFDDPYAVREATLGISVRRWECGVAGWPLRGLCFIWAAGALALLAQMPQRRFTRRLVVNVSVAFVLVVVFIVRTFGFDEPDRADEFTALAIVYLGILLVGRARRTAIIAASVLLGAGCVGAALELRQGSIHGADLAAAVADCAILFFSWLCMRRLREHAKTLGAIAVFSALIGAAFWIYWAADATRWGYALDYRRWIGPLALPFFAFAAIDVFLSARTRLRSTAPSVMGVPEWLAATVITAFVIVLSLQYTQWRQMTNRLMSSVRQYPSAIVPISSMPWIGHTALDHWSTFDFVMSQQGKAPAKFLLNDHSLEMLRQTPPKLPHWDLCPYLSNDSPSPAPGPMGWYDMRPLLANPRKDSRAGPASKT
jgi:hypothetical protein